MNVDHAVPRSSSQHRRFGAVSCYDCNHARGSTPLLVWLLALHTVDRRRKRPRTTQARAEAAKALVHQWAKEGEVGRLGRLKPARRAA